MSMLHAPRTPERTGPRFLASLLGRSLPLLLLLGLLPGLTGCASSAPLIEGPVRMTQTMISSDGNVYTFELVNDAHTDASEYYSKTRDSNQRKVQTNDIMSELVAYVKREGWDDYARPGSNPSIPGGNLKWILEMETPQSTTHLVLHTGVEPAEQNSLHVISNAFIGVYNSTGAAQSVRLQPGEDPFKTSNTVNPGNQ